MLPLELSSHLLEIPNDVYSLLSQILIGWSLYSRELRKLIGLHQKRCIPYEGEKEEICGKPLAIYASCVLGAHLLKS